MLSHGTINLYKYSHVKVLPWLAVGVTWFLMEIQAQSRLTWMEPDRYDEIIAHMDSITVRNCRSKSKEQLTLRQDVLTQLPYFNTLLSKTWYRNRSSLIHLHNMALNRAFFYSYILQKMNTSISFSKQPGWAYFYLSATADVNSNLNVLNGSAIYFDSHCHYPNWYSTVPFNKTLPLFGPKVYRWDDTRDQDNLLREPTRQVVQAVDYGAGLLNYTDPRFKMNPWYSNWMPDILGNMDSLTKFTYYVRLRKSNVTGQFERQTFEDFHFYGPPYPSASESHPQRLPVQFTSPYFDCGGSNKWVVSTYSPVIDFMPRYSNYTHLRRQRVVAVTVMDTYFMGIDFNPCGLSPGHRGPNYLAGVHRCKKTTLCKHKAGYGFRRGGYTCVCGAGLVCPWYVELPFQGEDIERATEYEYRNSFSCTKIQFQQVLPVIENLPGSSIEGTESVFGSGGLGAAANSDREERSSDRNINDEIHMSVSKNLSTEDQLISQNVIKNMTVRSVSGHTILEIIKLADKIRHIRDSTFLQNKPKSVIAAHQDRNNVEFDVDKYYQKDLEGLRKLTRMLFQKSKNLTLTFQTIQESVAQLRTRHIERFQNRRHTARSRRLKRESVYDDQAIDRMLRIFRQKSSVTGDNCHKLTEHQLYLPGDVTYGVRIQFESEGRTALRLAHFISMYLQNVMPGENFGNLRGGGLLHEDQIFAEVIANVMGNFKIYSSGIFFDSYKFQTQDLSYRELFGPEAFRYKGSFYAVDTAGYSKPYREHDWFTRTKSRFATNTMGTKVYKLRPYLRSDSNGSSNMRHEYFPLTYRAATYETGFWTRPYFRCDGYVDSWVMKYVVPFFGQSRKKLEFRGVVTVEVPLNLLEINQCPMPYNIPNAFKNTARCDYFSTKCSPLAGFPLMRGSYRCNCRLGFEYRHLDGKIWIEGSLLELEYEKKRVGLFSRFDHLKCRVSGACHLSSVYHLVIILQIIIINWFKR